MIPLNILAKVPNPNVYTLTHTQSSNTTSQDTTYCKSNSLYENNRVRKAPDSLLGRKITF